MAARRLVGCGCLALAALLAGKTVAAQEADDLSDVLEGFEREEPGFEVRSDGPAAGTADRDWDLSGSVEISGSVNFHRHRSDTNTNYVGLQRLRNRLNLQLDAELADDWRLRLEGWGFYDAAYWLQGRGRYTSEVRRNYESDAEVGEAWLSGELFEDVDVRVGRQVEIWGRSETLRVLDVLNPLDNREPGRVDLEDLRRPVSMLRVKGYAGRWSATAIVVPEIRFDENPVVGSDFFPGVVELPEQRPQHFQDLELAGAVTGIFSGWDVSFHGAWFWDDRARPEGDPGAAFPSRLVHDRLWMLGSGGNAVRGSWLFKYEVAYLDGLGFSGESDRGRLDALLGVEYYGWTDTTLVVEAANRHLFDHGSGVRRAPNFTREDTPELALRLRRNFWNDTLHATAVAVLLGWDARDGSIARLDLDYDVLDALVVGVGILLYQQGDLPPLDSWGDNDRVIFKLKWSF